MAGFEVLVLPVRATTAPGWPDAAYRHVLDRSGASVPPANRTSVGDYWFDVTDGAVDLSFRHHTPTTLSPTDPRWQAITTLATQPAEVADATMRGLVLACLGARLEVLAHVRAVLLVSAVPAEWSTTAPMHNACRNVDIDIAGRGAQSTVEDLPVALWTLDRTHSVLAHELGHALGMAHPFGRSRAQDGEPGQGTEYGSPLCIMSAARYQRRTDFALPTAPTSPVPAGAAFSQAAGPAVSRATIYRWATADPLHRFQHRVRVLSTEEAEQGWDIGDAGSRDVMRTLVISAPELTVIAEVRRPRPGVPVDWDAGLRHGVTTQSTDHGPGVVLHTLEDQVTDEGSFVTDRVSLLGTIPLPLGAQRDRYVGGLGRRISVERWDPDRGVARLRLSAPFPESRAAWITTSVESRDLPLPEVTLGRWFVVGKTFCGTGREKYRAWHVPAHAVIHAAAHSVGLDGPGIDDRIRLQWTVAGIPLAPVDVSDGPASAPHTATLTVRVPVGDQEWRSEIRAVTFTTTTTASLLRVDVPPDQGIVPVTIGLRVQSTGGALTAPVSVDARPAREEAATAHLRFEPALAEDRAACERWFHREVERAGLEDPDLVTGLVRQKVLGGLGPRLEVDELRRTVELLAASTRVRARLDALRRRGQPR